MTSTRFNFPALLLRDGSVLAIAGNHIGNGPVATGDVYDPVTGTWTETSRLRAGRALAAATPLSDGDVLVCGGEGPNAAGLNSAEIFGPAPGS
jgi:hypothetical protein